MITPRKTRIPYLDFLKFFAIASVLLGHSVEQTTGNDFWDNPIRSFIYTYHMPLFMLLCGYFFGSLLNLSFGELVKKKFVQLVIPSLSAFAIMYAFVMLTGYNPCPELMDFSWFGFFNAVWFLKCVFFCYLIGYIALKSLRSFWAAALVSIVLFTILPIGNVDNINFMLPMFWLGYFCQKEQEVIDRHRRRLLIASLVAFAALLPFGQAGSPCIWSPSKWWTGPTAPWTGRT
ncbi:acyltransferase family protein [Phocaeicola vulgatus]|nr:acyltransferase family protein [Phocaeicola vulgatus]